MGARHKICEYIYLSGSELGQGLSLFIFRINGFKLPDAFVHDRDAIFGKYLDRLLEDEFGVRPIVTDYKSPWQNAKVERFHLSLKDEVLYRVPISDVSRVRNLCIAYQHFHNHDRTHQSLEGHFPSRTNVKRLPIPLASVEKLDRLGGLVTIFREAA